MKKIPFRTVYLILLFQLPVHLYSQENTESFKPHGNPFATLFANFFFEMGGKDETAFEVRRAYLGYQYYLSEHWSGVVKLDIGSPGDESPDSRLKRYAYFKNAGLEYHSDRLTWNIGIIDTKHFGLQEKYWGHRYIYKSFQDEHKFGPKADIGTSLEYSITDHLVADISLMNGEGYSRLQLDKTYKTSIGFTGFFLSYFVTRIYFDIMVKSEPQATNSLFLGYKTEKIMGGFEYSYKINDSYEKNHHAWGYSIYALYRITPKFELFGRFDKLDSKRIDFEEFGWNYNNDGSAIIAGVQYSPIENIKFAIDYQDWVPY
ncbi:MAG: hypothetical protein JSV24_09550, partial [Bacteroidales bacterium]